MIGSIFIAGETKFISQWTKLTFNGNASKSMKWNWCYGVTYQFFHILLFSIVFPPLDKRKFITQWNYTMMIEFQFTRTQEKCLTSNFFPMIKRWWWWFDERAFHSVMNLFFLKLSSWKMFDRFWWNKLKRNESFWKLKSKLCKIFWNRKRIFGFYSFEKLFEALTS